MTLSKLIVLAVVLAVAFPFADAWVSTVPASRSRVGLSMQAVSKIGSEDVDPHNASHSSSRRLFFEESRHAMLVTAAVVIAPKSAHADYGKGTSMNFPSYIDYLIEKNTGTDNSKALYTGADPATVLRRLAESEARLGEIRGLAEQKKWSQINGILTGPLGTLSSSMSQIVSIVSSSPTSSQKKTKQVQDTVKKVKADVFAIGQGASRKDPDECTKQAVMASTDLKALLEIAFD